MTSLEKRVSIAMEDYLQTSENDLYMVLKNIVKHHGPDPIDEQIHEELELFYNSH